MAQPTMMFYHDGRHPLIYMYEPPIRREEYQAGIDELVGTPIQAIMFCLGDGRTVLHDTSVGELWGDNVEKWPHLIFRRASQNARHLIEEVEDPLTIMSQRAHEKGMLIYPTLLVQQGRGPSDEDVRCSTFRFDNQHLEIGANGGTDPSFPGNTCLDFKHEEVREERFALIEDTLLRYDIDGFELQLNYFPYYFHPNEIESGREIMTAWVRRVYEAVKASGSDRELVIRVPANVGGCMSVGLDVKTWIMQGIVDVLVGQTFSGPELVDTMANFRSLVQAAHGYPCRVHATIQSHVDSDRLQEAPIEIVRATACNYWEQGIDGLYLDHWFGNWPYESKFYEKLRELPHPDIMATQDKYYYLPTETGRYSHPPLEPGLSMQLPADLSANGRADLHFAISDDLTKWGEAQRIHEVIIRMRVMNVTEKVRLSFRLNGQELPDSSARIINEMYRMKAPRYRTGSGYWFIWRLDQNHWPVRGANNLQIVLLEDDPDTLPSIYLRDVEMEIKYLKGHHFNRGQDSDLGPYEMMMI